MLHITRTLFLNSFESFNHVCSMFFIRRRLPPPPTLFPYTTLFRSLTNDAALAARVRRLSEAEEWPEAKNVFKKILLGNLQRKLIGPYGFTFTMFLAFYIASFFGDYDLSRYLWEKIRPLDPLPDSYRRRYTNAQAMIGLEMLKNIDAFNALNRAHAKRVTAGLSGVDGVRPPAELSQTESVYYQYCIRAADPDRLKHRAIRAGVDVEIMHVDICNVLELFERYQTDCPVAEATAPTLQLPVYASLTDKDLDRIINVIRNACRVDSPVEEKRTYPA